MINGIVNVYKEKGFTSFDVVAVMRKIAGERKIGHTGTLDPDAEGVLPVCIGNATKLCDMLTDKRKEYVASFLLGIKTDTLDISGTVLERKEPGVSESELREAILSFVGGYDQIPPMYSAKKVDGKKLYDLAREGIKIERKAAFVEIYDIEILDMDLPNVTIRVECGKGTYIRSLCEDIAAKCGELAVMTSLKRTRVKDFTAEEAYTLDELKKLKEEGRFTEVLLPTDRMFTELAAVNTTVVADRLLLNGNKLTKECFLQKCDSPGPYRVYTSAGVFTAVYEYREKEELFYPFKMFLG